MRDFLLDALAVVVSGFLSGLARLWVERRYFAGPRLDEWRQARRQLRGLDQPRVLWATSRNRPVSRAALAGAQLAYVRYRQDMAQRVPRWLRPAVAAFFGAAAVFLAAIAVAQSQQQVADGVLAAGFAVLGLGWWLAVPWWLRRLIGQLARLQAQIGRAPGFLPEDREMP